VACQVCFVDERLMAEMTYMRSDTSVDLHVWVQGMFVCKCFVALFAGKHLDVTVCAHMDPECILHPEGLVANFATETSFTCMLQIVSFQCKHIVVGLRTLITHELGTLAFMQHHVAV
jgi:hypothetical protein